jgi:hypothetical protein
MVKLRAYVHGSLCDQAYGLRRRLSKRPKRAMRLDTTHGIGPIILLKCGRAGKGRFWYHWASLHMLCRSSAWAS